MTSARKAGTKAPSGGARSFDATIEAAGQGGAAVAVPFDVKEAFGSGRPRVRALIDGHEYRGSIANMGSGHVIGVRKDVRGAIGKDIGDRVHVVVELDTEERVVTVPKELARTLAANQAAKDRFERSSYTHRKEFARWVAEAKKQETRDRRAERAIEMILEGASL